MGWKQTLPDSLPLGVCFSNSLQETDERTNRITRILYPPICSHSGHTTEHRLRLFRFKASQSGTFACVGGRRGPYTPPKSLTRSIRIKGIIWISVTEVAMNSASLGSRPGFRLSGSAITCLNVSVRKLERIPQDDVSQSDLRILGRAPPLLHCEACLGGLVVCHSCFYTTL